MMARMQVPRPDPERRLSRLDTGLLVSFGYLTIRYSYRQKRRQSGAHDFGGGEGKRTLGIWSYICEWSLGWRYLECQCNAVGRFVINASCRCYLHEGTRRETARWPVMYGLAAVMEYYYRSASTCWGWISGGGDDSRRCILQRAGAMRDGYDNATRETRPRDTLRLFLPPSTIPNSNPSHFLSLYLYTCTDTTILCMSCLFSRINQRDVHCPLVRYIFIEQRIYATSHPHHAHNATKIDS